MLSDLQIGAIVQQELEAALSYEGEIAAKRTKLMDYYNSQPFGDEVEGQSSVVSSDVADTIEWMLPSLLRIFVQGKTIATFDGNTPRDDEEAKQKTFLSNWLFLQQNSGVLTLHNMFKDALLQYTGTVKVYWDEWTETREKKYRNLSDIEYQKLELDESVVSLDDIETETGPLGNTHSCTATIMNEMGGIKYDNIPPEEFLIAKSARDFDEPVFCGHRSPKTRSDLIEMGFSKDDVDQLPADEYYEYTNQKNARYHDLDNWQDINAGNHSPNDILYLGEYYLKIDVNEDGITEYWQVFYAGNKVLSKEQVDAHPFATVVPIPIPHRAIGTCPADQVCDIQYRKSTLLRQALNNVYQANYPRLLHSTKVDMDDLLTPRPNGTVEVDSENPDVVGHASYLQVNPQLDGIMGLIEFTEGERETRTGVSRYNQGLDAESLNKTATGFLGMKDSSQQRMELIARIFADGGVKQIFMKTIDLLSRYQNEPKTIRVMGEPLEIDPRDWGENLSCRIDVGIGSGDRQEKIVNLNAILQRQMEFQQLGLVLADQPKIYKTLEKLITEIGLKDADVYFNNPEVPQETLFAENQQMTNVIQQLQQQLETTGSMAAAETQKAKATFESAKMKTAVDADKNAQIHQQAMAQMALDKQELEVKTKQIQVDILKTIADIRNTQSETEAQGLENAAVKTGLNDLLSDVVKLGAGNG